VDNGKTFIHDEATGNPIFVRPHLLEITRQPNGVNHFRATTKHINAAGPLVKVEALTDWGASVQVELSQEQFRALRLVKDEVVFITPREVAVFDKDEFEKDEPRAGSSDRAAAAC
jgi:sulfate/thiosulfate transport system ATP-binding protein